MNRKLLLASTCTLLASIGLLFYGCATRPPSRLESRFLDTVTNPPVVTVITNVIPVTIIKTNVVELTITNLQGITQLITNYSVIPVQILQTNIATITNVPTTYSFTPGAGAKEVQGIGTAIGNLFGVGGLVGTGLGALFSLYAGIRGRRSYNAAADTAQVVETVRQFIKNLPNGQVYDSALVQWMQAHQAEAGVLNDVVAILQREVSNADAKDAAAKVMDTITALRNLPGTPVVGKM